jgi:hypothetical protein
MMSRTYRATAVYGSWYDGEKARGFEGHFVASLSGKIGANRIKLAKFITPIFQKQIFQKYALRVSPGQIRIRFEREQAAVASSRVVNAEFLEMVYRGRERHAKRLTQIFELPKRRKHRKRRKTARKHARKSMKHRKTTGSSERRRASGRKH